MQNVTPKKPARVVKLGGRDVEDAKRLLSLLASNEDRIVIEPPPMAAVHVGPDKHALLTRARELITNRRRRHAIFGRAMFSEHAWEMLLLLYVFDGGARQTVGGISDRAGATRSTGLRWIEYLEKNQLVTRSDHPTDRRTNFLQLTHKGRDAIELYLSETVGASA